MPELRHSVLPVSNTSFFCVSAISTLVLVSLGLGCARTGEAAEASTRPSAVTPRRPVVIELFTSEGCSSCPPADDLLADLIGEAQSHGQPVYAMAFHVDYWDRLGWRDPFSSGDNSARQRRYAAAFGTDQVYTPQMVINGKSGFNGSDAREARKQVQAELEKPVLLEPTITPEKVLDGRLTIGYAVKGAPKGMMINVAVVERSVTTRVERGENGGRNLRHSNVVRAFGTAMLTETGADKLELRLPESLDPKNALVIGFVQDGKSMAVMGANSADFPR